MNEGDNEMKYINIETVKKSESGKTSIYEVYSNNRGGKVLGHIYWNGIYRQYTFYPISFSFFESCELEDIKETLIKLEKNIEI